MVNKITTKCGNKGMSVETWILEAHPSHFEPNYVVAAIIVVTTITLVTTITVVTAKIVVTVIVATTRGVLSGKCGHCDHLFLW